MELSDTESGDLYDNSYEQNKIKVDDCITWTLEYELRDSAVILKNSLPKKQLRISNFFENV